MTVTLLAGGGTAGHVNPLLAIADRLRERDPASTVLVLGTAEGLESRLVPARGFELLTIPKLPFPRRPSRAALQFPARYRAAVDDVSAIIADRGVDLIIGVGGYVAAPAYSAARRTSVPLAIHEANAKPGIANRLGARHTTFVGVAFAGTPLPHAEHVGMPLRVEIERLDVFAARAEALRFFTLDAGRPVLLVTGGSSGAKRINETIAAAAPAILGAGWQILHITGEYRDSIADPGLPGYRLVKYCDRMDLALAIAELAVARSGTSTVAELAALGIPAVFVPYPVGNGEQRLNPRAALAAGAAIMVDDAQFSPEWAAGDLVSLLRRRADIAAMAARMAPLGMRDATDRMVALADRALAAGSAGLRATPDTHT